MWPDIFPTGHMLRRQFSTLGATIVVELILCISEETAKSCSFKLLKYTRYVLHFFHANLYKCIEAKQKSQYIMSRPYIFHGPSGGLSITLKKTCQVRCYFPVCFLASSIVCGLMSTSRAMTKMSCQNSKRNTKIG